MNAAFTPSANRKLLVLDLDETLIYATDEELTIDPEFICGPFLVHARPFLAEFLRLAFDLFHVGIWTSSSEAYAQAIVPRLLPEDERLEFLWTRDRCTQRLASSGDGIVFVKDLRKLVRKGYSLDLIIAIDDTPQSLARNYGNLVAVAPFLGDPLDEELRALMAYLPRLASVESVRFIEKRGWRRNA